MRKGLKIAGSTVFAAALSSCLFYCMVAGAKSGAVVYVVMAALLSVIISVTLCAGFHYIIQKELATIGIRNNRTVVMDGKFVRAVLFVP